MGKTVRILIAIILTIALTAAGFFAGYQLKVEVAVEEPIRENRIHLTVTGADAAKCVEYVCSDMAANRLVENLMLLCTPDDLQASISAETAGSDAFTVTIPMDAEGQMVYFAEELSYILNEEMQKEAADAVVTVVDQELVTVDAESRPNMLLAYIGAGVGFVLGVLIGIIIIITGKKSAPKYIRN